MIIHDPKVNPKKIQEDLNLEPLKSDKEFKTNFDRGYWKFSKNTNILENCHAALILTEWDEYKK